MRKFGAATLATALLLAACSQTGTQTATLPPSGVTASNGGGQRATGGLVDFGVTDGAASTTAMSRNPGTPRY